MIPEAASKLPYQFIVGYLVPSAFLAGAGIAASGWAPQVRSDRGTSLDLTTLAATIFVLSAALAVVLQILNPFFLRLFEGAAGMPAWLADRLRARHVARLRALTKKIAELEASDEDNAEEVYSAQYERYQLYPTHESDVLPSSFGNLMAAWEHYPYRRYGIDAITMWPRLAPMLSKPVSDAIVWAKTRFDMLFNTLILLPVWLVLAWRFAERWGVWGVVLLPLVALAAIVILRRLCFAAASAWGSTVNAAFDLHRLDVLKQTGILVSAAGWRASDEAAIWRELQWSMKFDHAPNVTIVPRRDSDKSGSPSGKSGD